MSEFYDLLDEYLGDDDALTDIRVVVRRLWFFDFDGHPTRLWQGHGRLFTSDGNAWLGTLDPGGKDCLSVPSLQDGRDGSSANYDFSLVIPDLPDESAADLYASLKEDQALCFGRKVTCYLAVFKEGEALRPTTPIIFFKELVMRTPQFNEAIAFDAAGRTIKTYVVKLPTKDGNVGRANIPNRSYSDSMQREYAKQLGVAVDKGAEYLAGLANRTYVI